MKILSPRSTAAGSSLESRIALGLATIRPFSPGRAAPAPAAGVCAGAQTAAANASAPVKRLNRKLIHRLYDFTYAKSRSFGAPARALGGRRPYSMTRPTEMKFLVFT